MLRFGALAAIEVYYDWDILPVNELHKEIKC